jgi:hypothetical protein
MTQWVALLLASSPTPKEGWSPIQRFTNVQYPASRSPQQGALQNQTKLLPEPKTDATLPLHSSTLRSL